MPAWPPRRPISLPRALVYAACVIVPWAIIGAICILLAGCGRDLMPMTTEAAVPPHFAFYVSAPETYPRPDHVKDCNDYAVENAARLRAEGLDPYFVVAIDEAGGGHMVTAIDRNGETLVYDNRLPEPEKPILWRLLPYRWIEREGAGHFWYSIANGETYLASGRRIPTQLSSIADR